MMQRADFNEQFVQQASGPAVSRAPETSIGEYVPTMEPPAEISASAPPTMTAADARYLSGAPQYPGVGYRAEQQPQTIAATYTQEQTAQQPYRQPEQPAPITNEQRTTMTYPEQFRQSTVQRESQPAQAAQLQPEKVAATLNVPAENTQEIQQPAETVRTHTVESTWHRVQVENGTNRIVEGQPEGRALSEEKRAESTPPPPTDDQDDQNGPNQQANGQAAGSMYQQLLPGSVAPMITSGQIGMSHELASGEVDAYHRLDGPPRNPIVTALTSPLLWVGVIVLLLAFFASAFL
jgi:hypothetical protein